MPTATAVDVTPFENAISIFLSEVAVKAQGGLTWAEIGELFWNLMDLGIKAAKELAIAGLAKKGLVLQALEQFLNMVTLPLPWYLAWLGPRLKELVLKLADGFIQSQYEKLKKEAEAKVATAASLVVNPATTG